MYEDAGVLSLTFVSLLNRMRHCSITPYIRVERGINKSGDSTLGPVFPFPIFSLNAFHCLPWQPTNSKSILSSLSVQIFFDALEFWCQVHRSWHWSFVRPGTYSATLTQAEPKAATAFFNLSSSTPVQAPRLILGSRDLL